jgi:hypothetical protein
MRPTNLHVSKIIRLYISTAQYSATQVNTKINEIQKQIGAKKKVRCDRSNNQARGTLEAQLTTDFY